MAYYAKTKKKKKEKKKKKVTLEATFDTCTIDDNNVGVALVNAGHGDVVFRDTVISDSTQAGIYRLDTASRAINSGTTVSGITHDLDGNARPLFKSFDMGAYEYTNPAGSLRILSWEEVK